MLLARAVGRENTTIQPQKHRHAQPYGKCAGVRLPVDEMPHLRGPPSWLGRQPGALLRSLVPRTRFRRYNGAPPLIQLG